MKENNIYNKAYEFEDKNDYHKAVEEYEKLIELNEGDQGINYQYLARALFRQKKFSEAKKACKKALLFNQKLSLPHNLLGLIYLKQGEYVAAEMEFLKSTELNPNDEKTWYNLAFLYYFRQDKKGEAKTTLQKGLVKQPRNSILQSFLLYVRLHERDFRSAYSLLRKINEKNTFKIGGYIYALSKTYDSVFDFLLEKYPFVGAITLIIFIAAPFASNGIVLSLGLIITLFLIQYILMIAWYFYHIKIPKQGNIKSQFLRLFIPPLLYLISFWGIYGLRNV